MRFFNILFLRSFLFDNNLKFIEGIVYEDNAFFDCTIMVKKIGFIEGIFYHYVRRADSTTMNNGNIIDKVESLCVIAKHVMDRLENETSSSLRGEILTYLKSIANALYNRYKEIGKDEMSS